MFLVVHPVYGQVLQSGTRGTPLVMAGQTYVPRTAPVAHNTVRIDTITPASTNDAPIITPLLELATVAVTLSNEHTTDTAPPVHLTAADLLASFWFAGHSPDYVQRHAKIPGVWAVPQIERPDRYDQFATYESACTEALQRTLRNERQFSLIHLAPIH